MSTRSRSKNTLIQEVIEALSGEAPMTILALKQRVKVRHELLFLVLAELEVFDVIKPGMEKLVARDGKLRWLRVYSLLPDAREAASILIQPLSQFVIDGLNTNAL